MITMMVMVVIKMVMVGSDQQMARQSDQQKG